MTRPPEIIRWEDLEGPPWTYRTSDEPMGPAARYGRHFAFARLGINHCRLSPGMRSSLPHAESTEDEFVYVLEGTPDYWRDGVLYRLAPGDAVGFPAGTGLAHSFINNTAADVRLLVVGDTSRADNRILYPVNPDQKALREDWWHDAPSRLLGPHDGKPAAPR
jgi:uncharacterized cupin superfamily protein